MNLGEFYSTMAYISRKNQRGFLRPADFQRVMTRAQQSIWTKYYGSTEEYQPGRPIPRIAFQNTKQISNALRPFMATVDIPVSSNGQIPYPDDFARDTQLYHTLYKNTDCGGVGSICDIEILDDNQVSGRRSNSIKAPTLKRPIAEVHNTYFRVYPKNIQYATLKYLRWPKDVVFDYTITSNVVTYNPANSVEVEFEQTYHNEIMFQALEYVGMSIRENQLKAYMDEMERSGR